MTTTLLATTELVDDHWLVTVEVQDGSLVPKDIFIYENNGTSNIDDNYYGVCSLNDIVKLQIFSGTPIPLFGNKFVRYNKAKIKIDLADDAASVINVIKNSITYLSTSMKAAATTTQTIVIP
jgi:hypothetical protein